MKNTDKEILMSGKETAFWKEIVRHLNERAEEYESQIQSITDQINDDLGLDAEEEKKLGLQKRDLKNKRAVYLYLRDLPDILARDNEQTEPKTDPY